MHHDGFNQAVKANRSQEAVGCRLTTEICVTFPVLQMLDEGYEVQVSADASASYTKYGDDIALRRMEKAGAIINHVDQIISELAGRLDEPARSEAGRHPELPLNAHSRVRRGRLRARARIKGRQS